MLTSLIRLSLQNRGVVLLLSLATIVYGTAVMREMPIDVFPDLNRPTVTIMTEAVGLAPEEVEALVTRPIELGVGGVNNVLRVRSSSNLGFSIVWVEFQWGTDVFRARQFVSERLQLVRTRLPGNANPVISPVSSIMGEIMLVGLRIKSGVNPQTPVAIDTSRAMELRTMAEFPLRNRLLSIEGISQVTVMGGVLKQIQVLTNPTRLAAHNVTLSELTAAASKANVLAGGGIVDGELRESIIRFRGQSLRLEDVEQTPIRWSEPTSIRIRDVADVVFGGPVPRGDAAIAIKANSQAHQTIGSSPSATSKEPEFVWQSGPAVILAVQKQPGADTLRLDQLVSKSLDEFAQGLPNDVALDVDIFRQSEFISASIDNVLDALRDGAIWVVVVLYFFLGNFRSSLCSLIAMPMSILLTFVVFRWFGLSMNTMTMGGIAVAVGDLVDDSIVDVENIQRRLKDNARKAVNERLSSLSVVLEASCEVRGSIVYATLIVILVVCPLFAMDGLEGRIFAPLGVAYIVALVSSLVVSMTLTPVLGSLLLGREIEKNAIPDPIILRWMKRFFGRILQITLKNAWWVLGIVTCLVVAVCAPVAWMGSEYLPELNEGTFTINLRLEPGASLRESRRIADQVQHRLLEIPEVVSIARRTGRAELDEHAEGVNSSDLEVRLSDERKAKPGWLGSVLRQLPLLHALGYEQSGRPRRTVLAEVRHTVSEFPGVAVDVGQPISHRLDHVLSGVRAQIAIKIFGDDISVLRSNATQVIHALEDVSGIADLRMEPQVDVRQLHVEVDRVAASRYALAPGDVAELLETAFKGRAVSQVLAGEEIFELIVWFDSQARNDAQVIRDTILETPSGRRVSLGQVSRIVESVGASTINREGNRRRIVVSCNVHGRDLASVVNEIRAELVPIETQLRSLPSTYSIEVGGRFEALQQAGRTMFFLSCACLVGITLLLSRALQSWRAALQVMANIPLAACGSIVALLVVNRPSAEMLAQAQWWEYPRVWIGATTLSLAHWVGFITLTGIVCRNGILMISHYLHLMRYEGEMFSEQMIIRGSLERLAPVMMTAITSFVGLLPLLFGGDQPGKELLHPMAVVVFGGMLMSTLLDQLVTPALFFKFGRPTSKLTA